MPNWCNNDITISHKDPAKLEALATAIREGNFFKHIIPIPESLNIVAGRVGDDEDEKQKQLVLQEQANLEKYGVANWYDFCVSKWGTKWDTDPYDPDSVVVEDGSISFGFDTAWAPPVGIYEEMENQGYSIRAYYYEPGMAFVGKWEDGCDDYYEYGGETSSTVREVIGEELDDMYGISESMAEWEEENEEDES